MPIDINSALELAKTLGVSPDKFFPLFVAGLVLYLFISGKIDKVKERIEDIEKAVVEIQTIMRTKKVPIQHAIAQYGRAGSPIVLKDEFRPFVRDSGLAEQVAQKLDDLTELVRKANPATGLDAQKYIGNLVTSDEIERHLDVTKFKQLLYTKGKTVEDYYGILTVYLFEAVIPKLHIPDGAAGTERGGNI